ncbi:uncharacterized protein LOC133173724 [Saccostrea echinata]|uniref:uncharacterized protein LOC133173724 n=1 Tax=Saccostrea echinata TaxID=191078 RepID=UPI002A83E694|nr:uncharacterized protein LOC133173724 [Saccostrea echinata]
MLNTMNTMQQTVMGLQQTVLRLMSDKTGNTGNSNNDTGNSLDTAYAAMRSQTVPATQNTDFEVSQSGTQCPRACNQSTTTQRCFVELEDIVQQLWTNAVAPSTRSTYRSAFHMYVQFLLMSCAISSAYTSDIPVTEDYLIYFVAHCVSRLKLSFSTIKLYLCGIKFICLESNIAYPDVTNLSRLKALLNGVKRMQLPSCKLRHPISFDILKKVCIYFRRTESFRNLMLETVCTIAFFGFLRCGEFTIKDSFDPTTNLCVSDLSVLESCVLLNLKISKTDPFRKGITIKLFPTSNIICPFSICCKYLKARCSLPFSAKQPLFVNSDGNALTRTEFISELKHALKCIGCNSDVYNGHSFRIGAATTAAAVHMEDHLIKVLGRWSSDACCRYIRTPETVLREAQKSMTTV